MSTLDMEALASEVSIFNTVAASVSPFSAESPSSSNILAMCLLVFVRQYGKRAPTRVLRRDWIALHPAAHRELEKIVAGLAALVQIRRVETPVAMRIRGPRRSAHIHQRKIRAATYNRDHK